MDRNPVVKIFFPHHLLNSSSGLCLGMKDQRSQSICILAIIHPSRDGHDPLASIRMVLPQCTHDVHILGKFVNRSAAFLDESDIVCDGLINMEQRHHNGIPVCEVMRSPWKPGGTDGAVSPLLVLFDEMQVIQAHREQLPNDGCKSTKPLNSLPASNSESCPRPASTVGAAHRSSADIEFIFSAVRHFSKIQSVDSGSGLHDVRMTSIRTRAGGVLTGVFIRPLLFSLTPLICIARLIFLLLDAVTHCRFSKTNLVKRVCTYPAGGMQLSNKCRQFCELMGGQRRTTGSRGTAATDDSESGISFISSANLASSLLVDLLLGLLLLYWMHAADIPPSLAKILMAWADHTGTGLQQLLHWLMGAPAGLKLNTSLAHFLGNFFLYHVYLWIGYLNVLWPIMSTLLWCIAGSGVLGMSVQLALASDLLSLLTFHIYCFYVYAARIYSLQVSALLSLARLFQGKKWNVLRQRVDSCSYDVDQLFMGTLLFTMLLFMLPTTVLFYVVFTSLRLAILVIQGLLTVLRELLHAFPWFSLLLWLTGSHVLNSGIQLRVLATSPWQPTTLLLEMQLMPLSEALTVGGRYPTDQERQSFVLICQKLIRGQLIYPWGRDRG